MLSLLICDADSLCFSSSRTTIVESLEAIDEKIQNMFNETKCTHYVMFLTMGDSFRKTIYPEYKASRKKYPTPLLWVKTLKSYLIEKYHAQWMDRVEADDLSVWVYNTDVVEVGGVFMSVEDLNSANSYLMEEDSPILKGNPVEKVLATIDKDILKCIPGKHYNYTYKLTEKDNPDSLVKGWWVETTKNEAYVNFYKSLVCGDSTDGIKGIEGAGEKAFQGMLDWSIKYEEDLREVIFREYIGKYGTPKGIYEFQKNFRLLYLLKTDQDCIREIGYIPSLPECYPTNIQIEQEFPNF